VLQKLILFSCSFKNEEEEECNPERKRASCLFPGKKWLGVHFLLNCVDEKQKNQSVFCFRMACVGFG